MNPKIEFGSLSISRSAYEIVNFEKYDIEVSLEETESTETETKIKFAFTLVSDPKNTRVNVEGLATIFANQSESSKLLDRDENHIPNIVHGIYQEIFSLFYVISKSFQIPIPTYKLSSISSSSTPQTTTLETSLTETEQKIEMIEKVSYVSEDSALLHKERQTIETTIPK